MNSKKTNIKKTNNKITNSRKTNILIIIIVLVLLAGCGKTSNSETTDRLKVAVSIAPEAAFVKAIAGDLVDVVTLVPAGASPETYQPSPKEMSGFQDSSVYFTIGVSSEASNILPNIVSLNKDIKVVYLEDIVDDVYPARFFEEGLEEDHQEEENHEHEGRDPHMWMSPKRVIVMVEAIRDTLIEVDAENQTIYQENASKFIEELMSLDNEIMDLVAILDTKTFIMMHPSLGYFADDYGLTMVALEENGKEATARHLQNVIDYAKQENIKVIFYQTEFDSSQAKTLASEIDGEVLALDILSFDYINNMKEIIKIFNDVLNRK